MIKINYFLIIACLLSAVKCDISQAQVIIRKEMMLIPTWETGPAEVNPTFSWSASERNQRRPVYPYAFREILTNNKSDQSYTACWLENKFIKVLVLPEIGGRLHGAKDKTNNYNFFYWQPTVKPALIGMTGAWISGGIEWNFPTGHRPTAFGPVSYYFEENSDGSKTIWVGETEWIYRMRWLVGITIYPNRSIIEAKVRLSNPTQLNQSFWMWITTAVNANENYQAVHPTRLMTEHGKYEYFHWPIHKGIDLSWWKNIPNAFSFFAVETGDFFGGYDHAKDAGTVITGNKHIMIGKKLWTWGTSPFGRMWEPILTEGQGPYFEPQAGAYSDNQPDFHWMSPGEIKSFSIFFFPIRDIGPFKKANMNGALNLEFKEHSCHLGVYTTSVLKPGLIRLSSDGKTVFEKKTDLDPSRPFTFEWKPEDLEINPGNITLSLFNEENKELISYTPTTSATLPPPSPSKVYPDPQELKTADELWHAGDIIYKFRNPYRARSYFEEAILRDSGDTRSHISLAELDIKRAKYLSGLNHLETATRRDPDNGKIYYLQAVIEEHRKMFKDAYDLYYRATHFKEYLSKGYECIARLDLREGDLNKSIEHIQKALAANSQNPILWSIRATALRLMERYVEAEQSADSALYLDPLHAYALNEKITIMDKLGKDSEATKEHLHEILLHDYQCYLELALAYSQSGQYETAIQILESGQDKIKYGHSLLYYYLGYFASENGDNEKADRFFKEAGKQPVDNVFPFRLEGLDVFRTAIIRDRNDDKAFYYSGLIYAGIAEIDSAISRWQQSVYLNPNNIRSWRNLGLSYFTHFGIKKDLKRAKAYYEKAFDLKPDDSRILLEFDRVKQELGENPAERLHYLKKYKTIVESRDALLTTMLDLMVRLGEYENALQYYLNHHFHNWEGKYSIHNAFMEACIGLAKKAATPEDALKWYLKACEYPENLEIAPREPNLRGFLYFPMSNYLNKIGEVDEANRLLEITANEHTAVPTITNYFQARALMMLEQHDEASQILDDLLAEGRRRINGDLTGYERQNRVLIRALGHYYVSKVFEVRNQDTEANRHLQKAKELEPLIEREAIIFAQIQFAGAKQ